MEESYGASRAAARAAGRRFDPQGVINEHPEEEKVTQEDGSLPGSAVGVDEEPERLHLVRDRRALRRRVGHVGDALAVVERRAAVLDLDQEGVGVGEETEILVWVVVGN